MSETLYSFVLSSNKTSPNITYLVMTNGFHHVIVKKSFYSFFKHATLICYCITANEYLLLYTVHEYLMAKVCSPQMLVRPGLSYLI